MSEFPLSARDTLVMDELVDLWVEAMEVEDDPQLSQQKRQAVYSRAEELVDGDPDRVEKIINEARFQARQVLPARKEMDSRL